MRGETSPFGEATAYLARKNSDQIVNQQKEFRWVGKQKFADGYRTQGLEGSR